MLLTENFTASMYAFSTATRRETKNALEMIVGISVLILLLGRNLLIHAPTADLSIMLFKTTIMGGLLGTFLTITIYFMVRSLCTVTQEQQAQFVAAYPYAQQYVEYLTLKREVRNLTHFELRNLRNLSAQLITG